MILLVLLVVEFSWGLGNVLQLISYGIWIAFLLDFLLRFALAPEKLTLYQRSGADS